jgi:diguanylate cyclase (GGDEF)-like protein/PAS domain S-box-containing protein
MTTTLIDSPKENRILAALSLEEYLRLLPKLEFVQVELGQVLYASGDPQSHVYFPTSSIVSLVFTTENGSSAELAIIGNDGLVGTPIILSGVSTTHQAIVQSAGNAFRLSAELVRHEFATGGSLQSLSLRYIQALMAQMAQSVVCNRHHSVDKQLCRWLLLSLDRLPSNQLRMTHELIANMLGVRREGVTEAAGKLQMAGLIRYSRGLITVLDRPGLEARVCECYSVIRNELDRLFHLPLEHRRATERPSLPLESLRQRAELQLLEKGLAVSPLASDDVHLMHELQVHQIELEMQIEALQSTYSEADTLRERYTDIYDFAPVGYFTVNAEANILELNLAGAILLGIKRSEKVRHCFKHFVTPESQAEFQRFLTDIMQSKSKKICEIELLPNAQRAQATVRIEAVPDEDDSECRMVVIDISAEKQAERLLQEREHYLHTLLDNFPFMVWLKDEQSRFLAVNQAVSDGYGWPSPQSLIGKNDLDIAPEAIAESYQAVDREIMASGISHLVEEKVEADGETHWFETYKSPVKIDGKTRGTMGFSLEISGRKAFETTLDERNALKQTILNAVPTEIVVIDKAGVILVVNEHWQRFSMENGVDRGMPAPKTEIGSNYLTICQAAIEVSSPGALEARNGIQAVLDGKQRSFSLEYICPLPSPTRWFQMHVTPLGENAGEGAVITHTDVSERKRMENRLRQLALHDEVTRLPNQHLLNDRLLHTLENNKRNGSHGALFFISLDNNTLKNGKRRNALSDGLMIQMALRLQSCVRAMDTVARISELEFVLVIGKLVANVAESTSEASNIAEKICAALVKPFQLTEAGPGNKTFAHQCVFSIGVRLFNSQESKPDDILKSASAAMCRAKEAGINLVRFHQAEYQSSATNRPASQSATPCAR